jgi:hypothetical protein
MDKLNDLKNREKQARGIANPFSVLDFEDMSSDDTSQTPKIDNANLGVSGLSDDANSSDTSVESATDSVNESFHTSITAEPLDEFPTTSKADDHTSEVPPTSIPTQEEALVNPIALTDNPFVEPLAIPNVDNASIPPPNMGSAPLALLQ